MTREAGMSAPSVVARAVVLLCLFHWITASAKRATARVGKARPAGFWGDFVQSSNSTSYGVPAWEILTRTTSADHFSRAQYAGQDTFELRYALIWPSAKPNSSSPIFLFTSQESRLEDSDVDNGFYSGIADSLGAIQLWPEHRYYGSAPNRPADKSYEHLNIEQALVDQMELVLDIQRSYQLSQGPVIAIGSSYSGQLAAWLRVRYPDIIAGAISSSPTLLGAPGLGLDPSYDPFGFAKIATRTASSQAGAAAACPANVQKFFATLFARARSPAGLDLINKDLNLCPESYVDSYTQVNQTLAKYFQNLWVSGAQYNYPYPSTGVNDSTIPAYPVRAACQLLADPKLEGTPLFTAMSQTVSVFEGNASTTCIDTTGSGQLDTRPFTYQICTQDYTPVAFNGVTDMFYDLPYDLGRNSERCFQQFDVHTQYDWSASTFGLTALRSSSNILFTSGIYDPFTACSPTVNLSDTITAVMYEGHHSFDFDSNEPGDPPSVLQARNQGQESISSWVDQWNAKKTQLPLSSPDDLLNPNPAFGGYTTFLNSTASDLDGLAFQA